MKFSLLIFVIFFSNLLSAKEIGFKQFKDYENGITIKCPSTWQFVKNPRTVFIFLRPLDQYGQLFRENINLIISNSNGLDLNTFNKVTRKQMQKDLLNYKEDKVETIVLDNRLFHRIIYEHRSANMNLKVAYYFHIYKGKIYQFTCSTTKDNFSIYSSVFDYMMKSLTIGN